MRKSKKSKPTKWRFRNPTPQEVELRQQEREYWRHIRRLPLLGPGAITLQQIKQDVKPFKILYE